MTVRTGVCNSNEYYVLCNTDMLSVHVPLRRLWMRSYKQLPVATMEEITAVTSTLSAMFCTVFPTLPGAGKSAPCVQRHRVHANENWSGNWKSSPEDQHINICKDWITKSPIVLHDVVCMWKHDVRWSLFNVHLRFRRGCKVFLF